MEVICPNIQKNIKDSYIDILENIRNKDIYELGNIIMSLSDKREVTYDDIFNEIKYILSIVAFKDLYNTPEEMCHVRLKILKARTIRELVEVVHITNIRIKYDLLDDLVHLCIYKPYIWDE